VDTNYHDYGTKLKMGLPDAYCFAAVGYEDNIYSASKIISARPGAAPILNIGPVADTSREMVITEHPRWLAMALNERTTATGSALITGDGDNTASRQ